MPYYYTTITLIQKRRGDTHSTARIAAESAARSIAQNAAQAGTPADYPPPHTHTKKGSILQTSGKMKPFARTVGRSVILCVRFLARCSDLRVGTSDAAHNSARIAEWFGMPNARPVLRARMTLLGGLLSLAVLLAGCAPGSSGGSPRIAPDLDDGDPGISVADPDDPDPTDMVRPNAFSHVRYNFIGLNTTRTSADPATRILGRVQIDPVALLQFLPGRESVTINATAWRLEGAGALNALVNDFFEVDGAGIIRLSASNTFGLELSLHFVVNELGLSAFEAVANITYTYETVAGANRLANREERAPIKITAVGGDELPLALDFVEFGGVSTESTAGERGVNRTYTVSGKVAENSAPGTLVSGFEARQPERDLFDVLGMGMSLPEDLAGLGYARDSLPTIYYRLSGLNASVAEFCERRYLLDNTDYRVRVRPALAAEFALNREADDFLNKCVLQASLNGVAYANVTTDSLSLDEEITRLVGTATVDSASGCTDNVTVARAGSCAYHAGVTMELTDVNEAPRLELSVTVATTPEGDVGTAVALAGEFISAVGPADVRAADRELARVTYMNEDADAAGHPLPLSGPLSGMPEISVSPSLLRNGLAAKNLFYLNPDPDAAGRATLMLNSSALSVVDFEVLNEQGYSGYTVKLRVTDIRSAGLVLTTAASLMLEVTDVIYKPVLFEYGESHLGYDAPAGILNLLPGFTQFIDAGGPVLGTVTAIDPESNTSDGIVYEYDMTADAVELNPAAMTNADDEAINAVRAGIAANFELNATGGLSLVGLDLRPLSGYAAGLPDGLEYDFNMILQAYNAVAVRTPANATTRRIKIKVSARPAVVSGPAVRFRRGLYRGLITEGVSGTGASGPSVSVRSAARPLESVLQPAAAVPDDSTVTPYYSFMSRREADALTAEPIRRALIGLFDGEDARFDLSGTDNFGIDNASGVMYLATDRVLNFGVRPAYRLLVRVAAHANVAPADSDYAVVLVTVEDVNRPPRITGLVAATEAGAADVAVTADAVALSVLATFPESTPMGTVLARFDLTDDNPLPSPLPAFELDSGGDAFVAVRPRPGATALRVLDRQGRATGDHTAAYEVVLSAVPDYDAAPNNPRRTAIHLFTDAGRYDLDPQDLAPVPAGEDPETVALEITAEVHNVNEPIVLRVTASDDRPARSAASLSAASVSESAPPGHIIAYAHLFDPEDKINALNVPRADLVVPAALAGALKLTFEASGPYYRLEVTDAAILENAGDGRTFELTVAVTENATGLVSAPAALNLRILNDATRGFASPALSVVLSISEQRALDLDGESAAVRTLLPGLFTLTDIHPDYDEFFPLPGRPRAIRLVDLHTEINTTDYRAEVAAALKREAEFPLFELSVADDEQGTVSLLLKEGKLMDRALLGEALTLNFAATNPRGASFASSAAAAVGTMSVIVNETVPAEVVVFGDRSADTDTDAGTDAARTPAAYTFKYRQSAYVVQESAGFVAGTICANRDATGEQDLSRNTTIEDSCYPTIEIAAPAGEPRSGRLFVPARDMTNQRYYIGSADLAAVLSADARSLGVIFTDAGVNIENLGIYRLNAAGVLEEAGDAFNDYFELRVNGTYPNPTPTGDVNSTRPALEILQKTYAELNRTARDKIQLKENGVQYPALDLLPLTLAEPSRTLSYFVVAGADADAATNASRRAIAQINFEVNGAFLNAPAFLSELRIGSGSEAVLLSDDSVTEVTENQWANAVNELANILNFTLVNPDGNDRDDDGTNLQNVHIALEVTDAFGGNAHDFDRIAGTASGNQLIRLGAEAASTIERVTDEGDVRREFSSLPIQLARNVHGEAAIKVTLREYLTEDPDRLIGRQVVLYRLRVQPTANTAPTIVTVRLGTEEGASTVGENAAALTGDSLSFEFDVSDEDFAGAPRQVLSAAAISLDGTSAMFDEVADDGSLPAAILPAFDGGSSDATVTQSGFSHIPHSFGSARFSVALTEREARGFPDATSDPADRIYTYPPEVLTATFEVTDENDPLLSCAEEIDDGNAAGTFCENRPNEAANFVLTRDFGDEDGVFDATKSTQDSEVVFYFRDDDFKFPDGIPAPALPVRDPDVATVPGLLTQFSDDFLTSFIPPGFSGGAIDTPLGLADMISDLDPNIIRADLRQFFNTKLNALIVKAIDLTNIDDDLQIAAEDAAAGGIKITLPVRVTLDQDDYDIINSLDGGLNVSFDLGFMDGGNPSAATHRVTGNIYFSTTANVPIVTPADDLDAGISVLEDASRADYWIGVYHCGCGPAAHGFRR